MEEKQVKQKDELTGNSKDAKYYKRLFDSARNFDTTRFDKYTELAAFYEGEQDKLAFYADKKPWVVDINAPYAADAIDVRVASLQANDYIGELEPLSPDDVENVKLLNQVYQNFWKEMNMDNYIDDAITNAAVLREAYIHIVYDPDSLIGGRNTKRYGQLTPYFLDPSSILIDPKALNFKKAGYVIVVERISKEDAEDDYDYDEANGGSFSDIERGESFLGNNYTAEQEEVLTKWTVYERSKKKIYKTVLIENKIVEETQELEIGFIPISQLRWQKKFKSPYGLSLMDKLLPLQKSVNSIESATTNTALQFAAPSFVYNKSSGLDGKAFAEVVGAPGIVIGVNGDVNQSIKQLITNAVDSTLIDVASKNEATIYKIAGTSEQFMGDFGTSGNTKAGVEQSFSRAKIVEHKFLPNLEAFIEDLSSIIISFITRVFKGNTIYSRGRKTSEGEYEFSTFNMPEGLEDINYTFAINLDIKTPYSKDKTKALMQELFQIEQQYDSPVKVLNILDILEQYDVPNKQELIARYKQLLTKDTESKAATITQWVTLTSKYGININIITQGIMEIINGKEMPTVDRTMIQVEQLIKQQQAQAQAQETQLMQKQSALAQQEIQANYEKSKEPATGDEIYNDIAAGDEML